MESQYHKFYKSEPFYVLNQDVFYDEDIQDNQQTREYSDINFLRKFNNFIKAVLINKYIDRLPYKYSPSIFDLCSGKGGDLRKWILKKPSHYVALEYQEQLIKIAIERLREIRNVEFPSIFVVADAGDESMTIDKVLADDKFRDIKSSIVFDMVSCQFAMHYMFESEKKLRNFLHNVSCKLTPGGFFIGTTIDSDRIVSQMRLDTTGSMTVENEDFAIKFGQIAFPKDQGAFGLKYYFYLKDAIGKQKFLESEKVYVPEYLVIFPKLIEIAKEYDLELVEQKNFHEFYSESVQDANNQGLFNRMVFKEASQRMTQEGINRQFEICGSYQVFAFKKMGQVIKRMHNNFGNYRVCREINYRNFV
ncbi:UNKNOWN [Stylonychia lemnae]|uniref:mRNA cap guanine-N(7) methyltransferase n=1 Tax=Stylonychia lemnae TaxID=5949 RepID=A0A077ZZ05_STYLE|nr:UNKNOWN [Stylonychia lemnae]|eukprot:CDW75150.1 UNKNOWN [Stylonychia lemnae]